MFKLRVVNIVTGSKNIFEVGDKGCNARISIFKLFHNVAKVTIIFIMVVCPSVLMQQLASNGKIFCVILCSVILLNYVEKM